MIRSWIQNKREISVLALFILSGFVLYSRGFSADFIFDDYTTIVDNPFIKRLDLVPLWQYDPSRFITNLTFTLNYFFFGLNRFAWHFFSLLTHIFAGFFLYRLILACLDLPKLKVTVKEEGKEWFALFAALIFLVHPIQTESVIYTVHRSTLLCALFIFAALYLYIRGRLTSSVKLLAWAAGLAYAGMMTKPLFMVFPLLVGLIEIYGFGIEKRFDPPRALIFFLICLTMLIIPFGLLGLNKLSMLAYAGYQTASWQEHLLSQFNVVMTYLRLLFFPLKQNLDYDYPVSATLFEFPTIFSFLAVLALLGTAVKLFSKDRWVSFGICWFFITLLPVIIFPLNDLIFEHWLYLPSAGFALVFGRILSPLFVDRKKFALILSGIVLILSVLTWQRAALWSDQVALLEDTLSKSPAKPRVHNNLGLIYFHKNLFDDAEKNFKNALVLDPDYFMAQNNLALTYLSQKKIDESRNILEKLVNSYPEFVDAHINLAQVYEKNHEEDKALEHLYRGLDLNPVHPAIYTSLGNIYQNKGMLVRAREAYQKAIWLKPESAAAFYNLGNVYFKEGNFFEALQYYGKAIILKPDILEAYVNSGNIYFYFGDYASAIVQYRLAIEGETTLPEAYFNLANALHATGAVQESKEYIVKAIRLYEEQGQAEQAEKIKKKLAELNL